MSVELIARNGGTLSSSVFGATIGSIVKDGIVFGCNVTGSGGNLYVSAGLLIIAGRPVVVTSTTVPVATAGELIAKINLDNASPISFVARTAQTLTQEAINNNGTIYEYQIATYTMSGSSVATVTNTAAAVSPKSGSAQSFAEQYTLLTDIPGFTNNMSTAEFLEIIPNYSTKIAVSASNAVHVSDPPTAYGVLVGIKGINTNYAFALWLGNAPHSFFYYRYNEGTWHEISMGQQIWVQSTQPTSPIEGDLWFW